MEVHGSFVLATTEKFYNVEIKSGPNPMDSWRLKDGFSCPMVESLGKIEGKSFRDSDTRNIVTPPHPKEYCYSSSQQQPALELHTISKPSAYYLSSLSECNSRNALPFKNSKEWQERKISQVCLCT